MINLCVIYIKFNSLQKILEHYPVGKKIIIIFQKNVIYFSNWTEFYKQDISQNT
jgi:hypothetical protein